MPVDSPASSVSPRASAHISWCVHVLPRPGNRVVTHSVREQSISVRKPGFGKGISEHQDAPKEHQDDRALSEGNSGDILLISVLN